MPIESAMINYRAMLRDDVRESLGMFKASVGDTESQQSGRAAVPRIEAPLKAHEGHYPAEASDRAAERNKRFLEALSRERGRLAA